MQSSFFEPWTPFFVVKLCYYWVQVRSYRPFWRKRVQLKACSHRTFSALQFFYAINKPVVVTLSERLWFFFCNNVKFLEFMQFRTVCKESLREGLAWWGVAIARGKRDSLRERRTKKGTRYETSGRATSRWRIQFPLPALFRILYLPRARAAQCQSRRAVFNLITAAAAGHPIDNRIDFF